MKYAKVLLCLAVILLALAGCGASDETAAEATTAAAESAQEIPEYYQCGQIFTPEASGEITRENEDVIFDLSHTDQGYIMVSYIGEGEMLLVQVIGDDMITYNYYITDHDSYATLPLTAGNGNYQVTAYVSLGEEQYVMSMDESIDVILENEAIPFLYPSQYVNFNEDMKAVKLAKELTADKSEELEAVSAVYQYVTENLTYDYDKAASVESGYLPDIDRTLEEKKGICFDYSALMTAMLRSVGIPTRLDIGYSQDIYHAWISIYTEEQGWINQVVEFDGEQWNLMDPTLASAGGNAEDYITEESNYNLEYIH